MDNVLQNDWMGTELLLSIAVVHPHDCVAYGELRLAPQHHQRASYPISLAPEIKIQNAKTWFLLKSYHFHIIIVSKQS